tara:strand:+ start:27030 stop:27800 length:771 start_codon:yes stop_codon:yes gene_type:complete
MVTNKYIFAIIFSCLLIGCTVTPVQGKQIKEPPTESFVKVYHKIHVVSCADPKDKSCPVGISVSTGSGITIDLIKNETTILTAGHVCDVGPTRAISEFSQTVEVLDFRAQIHQAWPILISKNNGAGAPDACLLWVPTLVNIKKVKLSKKPPLKGEELYYIGAPAGVYHPPVALIFKGIFAGPIDASTSLMTVPVMGGASGSGVFNFDNKLVGLVWGVNPKFHHISTIVRYRSLIVFLNLAKVKFKNVDSSFKHIQQ